MRNTSLFPHLREGFASMLDLLYPPRCGGCGNTGQGWWCTTCDGQVTRLDAATNAHVLMLPAAPQAELPVISAALFGPPLREGIHTFKYGGTPQLADVFARYMADAWRDSGLAADLFLPVPLHAARQRERGFNQSERLARCVARLCALPLLTGALNRTRRTEQQARLGVGERKLNVAGAFAADPLLAKGKRVVLVDDVLTTGATLVECATALYGAGTTSVAALTLARAQA